MERSLSHDTTFEDWTNIVFNLDGDSGTSLHNYKKTIVIELFNLQGVKLMAFMVYRCWVSGYQSLQELDANGSRIAIEKMVLQLEGWTRDTSVHEPQET